MKGTLNIHESDLTPVGEPVEEDHIPVDVTPLTLRGRQEPSIEDQLTVEGNCIV